MVKVREEQPLHFDGSINLELWLAQLTEKIPELNLARIREVCDLSQQAEEKAVSTNSVWEEGQSSYKTSLDMANILTELHMDEDGLVAALIYRAVRENQITLNHVKKTFGDKVAGLVEGVLRMAAISNIELSSDQPLLGERSDQLEQARRMLVSLVDDVRVALIKLAERTCAIRNIKKSSPEKRIRLAREIFEIYAPLAHRLGIGYIKWELEDIAFRYLEPTAYKRIAALLDEKRTDRQEYIERVIETLGQKLQLVRIEADIDGRVKHIYSIWRKMRNKGISFTEVYDVRAVRILVPEVNDCYRVLGVVHNLWRNVPHEFDDYIATPKENGYRSLHTAVIGPEGKGLEIQIRTHEMHEEAEFGVCSHWQYKTVEDDADEPSVYEERISWLRQILDWQEELGDVSGLADELLSKVSLDRVYVFTPDGHVIDMMPGSTPIDFAYRVHTEVGHKCRGAKINGRVVPLNHELRSGDRIEIIVSDEVEPRREWLHEHLGYISTSRARVKIQSWFGNRTKNKNIEDGKKLLLDELRHLRIEQVRGPRLLNAVGYEKENDLFAAIGGGDIDSMDVIEAATRVLELDGAKHQLNFSFKDEHKPMGEPLVAGMGDFAHIVSECCKPVPGDFIVGVIDDGNTVHVHRQDCIQALRADSYGRLMRLNWQENVQHTFPVTIDVDAYDRAGLLHDITGVFLKQQTNVIAMNSVSDKLSNRVSLTMVMEITSLNELLRTLEKIEQLPNVITARRTVA
ncbi:MAG TPA: bifunctional (p)ppGpp synthetase/guanosine-3',5'-bis(diphosphate) 3'-pyrophosphohydrolase [Gammaproteobacteria bacterium]|nr:bifunctional (p)ppGpp synthetase/guanosine-3',5'-bis(diphosphate) 3'-pyrophosphohydrolase [Gammaproteobacteria bacterium]HIL99077.1 bifunctional (p)ppGpp synthetase/guanosine-3',5'-bis(diphosphate) 3'-pyrophosphohydrolase [Pseudomonadales bacterium]